MLCVVQCCTERCMTALHTGRLVPRVEFPMGLSPPRSSGEGHAFWKGGLSHSLDTRWHCRKNGLGPWDLGRLVLIGSSQAAMWLWAQGQHQSIDLEVTPSCIYLSLLFYVPWCWEDRLWAQVTGLEGYLLHILIVLKCSVPQFPYLWNKYIVVVLYLIQLLREIHWDNTVFNKMFDR